MAVNYNDGKWHGWNGGECPVHPETVVEYIYLYDGLACIDDDTARNCVWSNDYETPTIAFCVIKEHREPREFWVSNDGFAHKSLESAHRGPFTEKYGVIHVQEVIE